MLPDVRSLKEELSELVSLHIRHQSRLRSGVFSEVAIHVIHEGRSMETHRGDGTKDVSPLTTASAEVVVGREDPGCMSDAERIEAINRVISGLALQMESIFFSSLDQTLEAHGQVASAVKGDPLASLLAAIEKMQLDFDDEGRIKDLTVVGGEEWRVQISHALQNDPTFAERWNAMLLRKQEEWRAREDSRKLAR